MIRKALAALAVFAMSCGLSLVPTPAPAGAAVIQTTSGYFLGGYRAFYFVRQFHDNGWGNLQWWGYNNQGTQLLGSGNVWFPDFASPIIYAGNGAGSPGRIDIVMDDWNAFPWPNITPWPGTIIDVDSWNNGGFLRYDKLIGYDLNVGSAWWGFQTLPVEFDNTDARVSFHLW